MNAHETLPGNFGTVVERREDVFGVLFVNGAGITFRVIPSHVTPTQPIRLKRKHR